MQKGGGGARDNSTPSFFKMVARLPRTSATIVSNFRNNLQSIEKFKELNVFVKDAIVRAEKKVDEITREGLSAPRVNIEVNIVRTKKWQEYEYNDCFTLFPAS